MADIDVVPKRRTNIWLWIVLAIVVVVVLWMLMAGGTNTPRTGRLGTPLPAPAVDLMPIGGGPAA